MGSRAVAARVRPLVWITLTELALIMLFVFVLIAGIASQQTSSLTDEVLALREYRAEVEDVLEQLGIDLQELQRAATTLVPQEFTNAQTSDLLAYIEFLRAENRRLISLVRETNETRAKLYRQLQILQGSGGSEPGSCWEDQDGSVEYLFQIALQDAGVTVWPLWPSDRADEVRSLDIEQGMFNVSLNSGEFAGMALPIFNRAATDGCRFFVQLKDFTSDKASYKSRRRLVERFFFIREVR